jgi:hypothetical protein
MSRGNQSSFGVITMAFGPRRYLRQAQNLSLSLKLHMPQYPVAIITNAKRVAGFDYIVPIDTHRWGLGVSHKVYLDQYTPFEETLFLDADCLVTRPFPDELETVRKFSFTGAGRSYVSPSDAYDQIDNLAATLKELGLSRLPVFNGGLYFFRRDSTSARLFSLARDILRRWQELGLKRWDGAGPNDETVFGLAAEQAGLSLKSNGDRLMKTLIGIVGDLHIDPLGGGTRFNKGGTIVEPAICHFSGRHPAWSEYYVCERILRKKQRTVSKQP